MNTPAATDAPAVTCQPGFDERDLATIAHALRQTLPGLHDVLLAKVERMREVLYRGQGSNVPPPILPPTAAYEVKTSDNRHYIVIATSWNEAARVASLPTPVHASATEMTRLTGSEDWLPYLLIAGE